MEPNIISSSLNSKEKQEINKGENKNILTSLVGFKKVSKAAAGPKPVKDRTVEA